MADPAVLLDDVTKFYEARGRASTKQPDGSSAAERVVRTHALRGVSLTIDVGEMVAIMGPSGSGKSTLLNLMGGLDTPSSGAVVVSGRDLAQASEEERSLFRRSQLAYIFQAYHLMPTLTAAQNVALPLHLAGHPRKTVDSRVRAALVSVGLTERAEHVPDELSGGERQRVAIARALVTMAPLVLADEPTGNLDSQRGEEILELLRRIHRDDGATLVMVTHDRTAAEHCERVLHIQDGRLAEDERL